MKMNCVDCGEYRNTGPTGQCVACEVRQDESASVAMGPCWGSTVPMVRPKPPQHVQAVVNR